METPRVSPTTRRLANESTASASVQNRVRAIFVKINTEQSIVKNPETRMCAYILFMNESDSEKESTENASSSETSDSSDYTPKRKNVLADKRPCFESASTMEEEESITGASSHIRWPLCPKGPSCTGIFVFRGSWLSFYWCKENPEF